MELTPTTRELLYSHIWKLQKEITLLQRQIDEAEKKPKDKDTYNTKEFIQYNEIEILLLEQQIEETKKYLFGYKTI